MHVCLYTTIITLVYFFNNILPARGAAALSMAFLQNAKWGQINSEIASDVGSGLTSHTVLDEFVHEMVLVAIQAQ